MFLKRDRGPCPIDGSPHTTCCAPTGGPIVAGPISTPTSITVPSPTPPAATQLLDGVEQLPMTSPTFTTRDYRGKHKGR